MEDLVSEVPVFRRKPPWVRIRMMFSLLIRLSFYVSSRRIRICIHIERNPQISLNETSHEDIFTVQALPDWFLWFDETDWSISSLESIDSGWRLGYRPRWIECRFPITNRIDPREAMKDLLSKVSVFRRKPPLIQLLVIFSLLIWISFYVSSRRVRICAHIERIPQISLNELDLDDVSTVQAMPDWFFWFDETDWSILSLESTDLCWRTGNRTRWIWCRSRIESPMKRCQAMEDFLSEAGRVTKEDIRTGVHFSWKIRRPIVYAFRDEVHSTRLNVQVYPSHSLYLFNGREHHQGEFSRRVDGHIRESVQR